MRALALALLLLSTPAAAQPVTRAQKIEVLTWARSFFADPYALRSTGISDIVLMRNFYGKDLPGLCIEFNAKNLDGAYTGIRRKPMLVREDGSISPRGGGFDTASCYAPQVVIKPFPELATIR